jgi:indolepyruvate decarboxylase
LEEAVNLITKSENPIVVADVELLRYKLNKEFRALIEKSGLPYVTMMMGKAILGSYQKIFLI